MKIPPVNGLKMTTPSNDRTQKILTDLSVDLTQDFDEVNAVEIDLETGLPVDPDSPADIYQKKS
jgi:hypothetical protein